MTAATRHSEAEPKPPERGEEDHVGGATLVLGYMAARAQAQDVPVDEASLVEHLRGRVNELEATVAELSARLVELAGAEQAAAELRRSVETLKAYNEKLQETIRTLEIGFRRHVSERVCPDQLRLALAAEPDAPRSPSVQDPPQADGVNVPAPSDPAAAVGAEAAPSRSTEQVGTAETPPGPEPKGQKRNNRHNHGRRRISVIPKVVIETTPPEVLLKGLESFECVGAEDSSLLGYRRGGLVELVLRRLKYVLKEASSAATGVSNEQPSPAAAPAVASEPVSPEPPSPSPAPAPAVAGEPQEVLVVQEHEALMVPADTGFKRSPFVDGAIVRFVPEPAEWSDEDGPVWIAPLPERPLDRSLADPSLLAHVLVHKLDYHTPYYRQEVSSDRYGFRLGRATMARWQFECGGLLMPLTGAMWTEALERSWFAMDATGTAIRDKEKHRYGHVFVLVAPGDGVLFRYTPQYDGATVEQLFGGYQGVLVADASANHNVLFGPGKAREAGCWSHARRRFIQALRAGEGKAAAFALQTIQALFRIEREAALCSPDERLTLRQAKSAPLIKALFTWVEQQLPLVPDHALLRAGLVYLRNQRQALCEFLLNGEIPIHNNASERALRRVVKGRQNWLSHGSDEHARRACAISSLIASCDLHGLDPELYLQELLTVLPSYPLSRVLDLSPKNWVPTRQRLIAEGRLKYLDLAPLTGSRLVFRDR